MRMFHQQPDIEIMVQSKQVYIYKLWDVCTLLNTRNSGKLTASRFEAGVSLCPGLTGRLEFKTGSVLQGGQTR